MHPDKRRAGRAIRKSRRLQREQSEADQFAAVIAFISELPALLEQAFRAMAEGFWAMAEALKGTSERNQPALPPAPEPLVLSEVGAPYPTHSGGEALKSAPVAGESTPPKQENRRTS